MRVHPDTTRRDPASVPPTSRRRSRTSRIVAATTLAASALTITPAATPSVAAVGPVLHDTDYEMIEFFAYTGTLADIAIGPGTGEFGNDLIVADAGAFSNSFDGGFRRLRDLNGDGDAKDAGESETFLTNAVRSPLSIDFGYGGDMYFVDYPSSTATRYVYKVTNAATPVVTQYTSNSIFNPNTIQFVPLDGGGELLTFSASQNFTVYGGTNDGRIFQAPFAPTGTVAATEWSDGSNIPEGSPDGWYDISYGRGTMPDGPFGANWVLADNQTPNDEVPNTRTLWALKDLNGDDDANDVGEARVILDDGTGYAEFLFGDDGIGYGTTSTQVFRFEDKNNDGDFWDAGGGVVDAGEKELFIDGLPGASHSLEFGPDGELYVIGDAAGAAAAKPVNIYLVRPKDADSDGVPDSEDNCVDDANPGQENQDGDPLGDACDPDADGDNTDDTTDNCIGLANPGQENHDGDPLGDACDPDDDDDGTLDPADAFPFDASETADTDGDGIGDNADPDDDNDQQSDEDEIACGSDPLDAESTSADADGDHIPDCVDTSPSGPAPWTSIVPARYLDTRISPSATTFDGLEEGIGRRAPQQVTMIDIGGRGDVPDDAAGAVVNITAINPSGVGFVTAYPCDVDAPNASSLNFTGGVSLGNEVVAGLDDDGALCVLNSTETDLAIDVVGFVGPESPVELVTPARIVETRIGPDLTTVDGESSGVGKLAAGGELFFQVAGRGGVDDDAVAAIVNVTAIGPEQTGYFTVHPCLDEVPLASSLNYVAGVNRGNEVVVELDNEGNACLFTSAPAHVTVDVVGLLPDAPSFMSVGPARILDSRTGSAAQTVDDESEGIGRIPAGSTTELVVAGRAGIADSAASAVLNVTAIRPAGNGYITMWPCGATQPLAATLNFVAGVSGGSEVIAGLGDGKVCIFNQTETDLSVDATGFVIP